MFFTTFNFVVFFAILFGAYYWVPKRMQWGVLLVGSLFFYGCATPRYLLLLVGIIVLSYIVTLCLDSLYVRRNFFLKAHRDDLSRDEKRRYRAAVEKRALLILWMNL